MSSPYCKRYESEDVSPVPLSEPLKFEFSGKVAKNRFLKAAMTERMSSWDTQILQNRGIPSKNSINLYRRWGQGGFGQILTGNIMIEYDHLEGIGNAIIPQDAPFSGERFNAFQELATVAKAEGALIVGQVSHPGRAVADVIQKNPISSSDVHLDISFLGSTYAKPRPATDEDIARVIEGFAHAAEYLHKAGFDGIQLHGAHSYLIAQFLSLSANKRGDKYGGTLENRARIIMEIASAVRARVPSAFILGMKINSVEFQDRGFTPQEAKKLCGILEVNQFDYVELSGGTAEAPAFLYKRESTRAREAFFIEFADYISPALAKTKLYVTGGLKTVGGMVKALGSVDGIGLGRAVCQDFCLPKDILSGKVKGVVVPFIAMDDISLSVVAAGVQIAQVGRDEEPFDISDEANLPAMMQAIGEQMTKRQGGEEIVGFPYLASVPYGNR